MSAMTGGGGASARSQLAAVAAVLRRHGLPMADPVDRVLQGSDADVVEFLVSEELWGMTGSIAYRAGIARSWEVQRDCEDAFSALGEWQMAHGYVTPDVAGWVTFFRRRRGLSPAAAGGYAITAGRSESVTVPWSARDVWLGVLAAAVIVAAGWGLVYLATALWPRPDVDLWIALVPNLLELLFLVPVWWFAVRKRGGSLRALGFVGFRPRVVAIGIALLFGFFMLNAWYSRLLEYFGLEVQADLAPIAERLSSPWPFIVTIVLVAPVVEEIFFRGFVFAGLRSRYGWRWAAAISAALFAAAHLQITFFLPAFLLGYLLAYLYQSSDSVWPGMIVHALMNGLAMVALYVGISTSA